jgi:predicted O-linked N-acetylglucosamine transferase (SPINDLY family)
MNDALLQSALRFHQAGQLMEAARLYSDIIRNNPQHFEALHRLGLIHLQSGRFADAERLLTVAIRLQPQVPETCYLHGCSLQSLERHEDALKSFARALALKPDYVEARNNRGVSLLALQRYEEALACFDKVLSARPGVGLVEGNRAAALAGLDRHAEALAAAERAIGGNPNVALTWYHKGAALARLDRFQEALAAFDRAVVLNPHYVEALTFRGIVLGMLDRHNEAVDSFSAGLRLAPGNVDLLYNRATSLLALKRFQDAMRDCESVLGVTSDFKYVRGNLICCRLHLCDWRDLEAEKDQIRKTLHQDRPAIIPLHNALISDDEGDQLRCSRLWTELDCPPSPTPLWRGERYDHDRVRIAYVSADFRTHAVASLMAGVFEQHDKMRFDVSAISLSDESDSMSERLAPAFERFVPVQGRDHGDVARLLRDMEIDIAIDLMGYTRGSRTPVFALRPAPIQVAHLGFPGTMGASYIDYIVADPIVAPSDRQALYAEKLVHMPHCYMPGDNQRAIAERPSRTEAGLPERGFVFCSFNNVAKIVPPVFDAWMRLLKEVEESVLWLSPADEIAERNLRREAGARGVDAGRLIFASFVDGGDRHLARLSLADLFLDTLPYNAHAGGSDALWAGVPIVSCKGTTFAGRVGASMLNAIGLHELAADSLDTYERLVLNLARQPDLLAGVRAKLARNRATEPLFDTKRFTRNLEAAYIAMWQRYQRGEPPAFLSVEDTIAGAAQ